MRDKPSISTITTRPRLKFIDMARSIAILLMVEGHFTGASLSEKYRNTEDWIYFAWRNLHGLTSPLFFTVTGLIFAYLLSADKRTSYFKNTRVKRGYKRVLELLFWGYLIQLNLWSIAKSIYNDSKFYFDDLQSFHVLQSIAVGIFILLLIYGIYKWINRGSLHWYYLVSALIMLFFHTLLENYIQTDIKLLEIGVIKQPGYLPSGAPPLIQNMLYGKSSDFNIVHHSCYVLLGGMLGSLIRKHESLTRKNWFGLSFIMISFGFSMASPILASIDYFIQSIGISKDSTLVLSATIIVRFGQVLRVLGIVMLIDLHFKIKNGIFLKIGQNSLSIYIVHAIILYGGIFGFGLKPYVFNRNLHPYVAVGISLFFLFAFAIMVKYMDSSTNIYNTLKMKLFFWRRNSTTKT